MGRCPCRRWPGDSASRPATRACTSASSGWPTPASSSGKSPRGAMSLHGWYQVAFERDLQRELTPASLGATRLLLVRGEGVRAFDATCPHRGAHLGFGGRLEGDAVRCPFHGYRIGLTAAGGHPFRAREYAAL